MVRATYLGTFTSGIAVGVMIALPLAAPIFGAALSDGVATLWGAALGAVLAVAGAVWAAGAPVRIQRQNAAGLVAALLEPMTLGLEELAFLYGQPSCSPADMKADEEPERPDLDR